MCCVTRVNVGGLVSHKALPLFVMWAVGHYSLCQTRAIAEQGKGLCQGVCIGQKRNAVEPLSTATPEKRPLTLGPDHIPIRIVHKNPLFCGHLSIPYNWPHFSILFACVPYRKTSHNSKSLAQPACSSK